MLTELNLLAPEVAAKKMSELWNQIPDWVVTLKSLKQ
jgi:alpha-galactosidase